MFLLEGKKKEIEKKMEKIHSGHTSTKPLLMHRNIVREKLLGVFTSRFSHFYHVVGMVSDFEHMYSHGCISLSAVLTDHYWKNLLTAMYKVFKIN